MNFALPTNVERILAHLENDGYQAYVVGGCVRDMIMGKEPHDYDICSSADPGEAINCLCCQPNSPFKYFDSGLKHGTISITIDGEVYEVTTFRIDGKYTDNRRPDSVEFTDDLIKDLSRRDFTINAMAYAPKTGLIDPFNGVQDIQKKIIRAVGDPRKRFQEDALRIMRGVRFMATYNFYIAETTRQAMGNHSHLIKNISAERISSELNKIFESVYLSHDTLTCLRQILAHIFPEINRMYNFKQYNSYHVHDVWTHTEEVVKACPRNRVLRIAALFHDIGKPYCYQEEIDKHGNIKRHFYGHAKISADIAKQILNSLRFPVNEIETIYTLIKYHDEQFMPTKKFVRRMLNKIGKENFKLLLYLREADIIGQRPIDIEDDRLIRLHATRQIYNHFDFEQECFTLKQLAINGNDLREMGFKPSPAMGKILNTLLDLVISERLENSKGVLLDFVENNREEILS